jgi:uncharacterized protein YerC
MGKKTNKQEGNQYDKIVKENIMAVIPALMEKVLNISAVKVEVIKEKLQHTKEREADVLRIITDNERNKFVLHIEFQVADESMINRMGEYYFMLRRLYNLPIRQFVVFLGAEIPKMQALMNDDGNLFSFQLLAINQEDYHKFLNSNRPEEIIFGILGNFGQEQQEKAVLEILNRIDETSNNHSAFNRHFQQLRILAKLRNLEPIIDKVMDSIAKYMKDENDILFIVGKKQEQEKFVIYLLREGNKTLNQIADITGASIDFVKRVKRKILGDN